MSYTDKCQESSREDVNALLSSICPSADVDDEYDHFLLLDYDEIKSLVSDKWDNSYIDYGFDAPDFPLCYDYADLCAAKVRESSIRENFKYRPAFGVLRYTMNATEQYEGQTANQRHAICFVVTAGCQIKYFEPQTSSIRWMDQPNDLKSLDNFYI